MDRRLTKKGTKLGFLSLTAMAVLLQAIVHNQYAEAASRWANHGSKCENQSRVSATMYNLPEEGKIKNFRAAVRLQGSGRMRDGRILDYRGRVSRAPNNCKTTKISASGQCLLSYLSVAADPRYHRMGDIISVPALKGLKITLPNSRQVIEHPGFFIVQNVGAAIKGRNRFDFFIGTDSPYTSRHTFGKMGLGDKYNCKKSFTKLQRGGAAYHNAYAMIYGLTDSTQTPFSASRVMALGPRSDMKSGSAEPAIELGSTQTQGGRRVTR